MARWRLEIGCIGLVAPQRHSYTHSFFSSKGWTKGSRTTDIIRQYGHRGMKMWTLALSQGKTKVCLIHSLIGYPRDRKPEDLNLKSVDTDERRSDGSRQWGSRVGLAMAVENYVNNALALLNIWLQVSKLNWVLVDKNYSFFGLGWSLNNYEGEHQMKYRCCR